jgi:RNA-binding protein YlmH
MTTLRRLFGDLLWEEKWIKLITISAILQQTLHDLSQKENLKIKALNIVVLCTGHQLPNEAKLASSLHSFRLNVG